MTEIEKDTGKREQVKTPHCPLFEKSIIVVDDNDDSRRFLDIALTSAGAKVCTFSSIEDLVRQLPALDVDLFILDLALHRESGIDLLHLLRTYDRQSIREAPAICLSAHAGDIVEKKAIEAGFDRFLSKPISIRNLVQEAYEASCSKGARKH